MEQEQWRVGAKILGPGRGAAAVVWRVRATAGRADGTVGIGVVVEPVALVLLLDGRGYAACAPGVSMERVAALIVREARCC